MTLHDALTALTGEPWCMRPWEVARLTDYQIDHVYRLPALARGKALEDRMAAARETTTTAPTATAPGAGEPPPDREKLIGWLVEWGARTREQAEREADERLANWQPD